MKLRQEHLEAFHESRMEAFVERMVEHLHDDLREHCEERGLTKERLDAFVREGMDSAEGYGITSEPGIQQYLDCMVVLGPDFAENEQCRWAGEVLRRDDLAPSEKAEALSWGLLTAIQWENLGRG